MAFQSLDPVNRLSRQQRHGEVWRGRRKHFFLVTIFLAFLLQMLFLSCMSYLYGSIWRMETRYHKFKVLYVDYDKGVVGACVNRAYHELQGDDFPTLVPQSEHIYPTMEHVVNAVKDTTYSAAFVTSPNASNDLVLALQGDPSIPAYDPAGTLRYVWNEVRFPLFSDQVFQASFQALTVATRLAYNSMNGSAALSLLDKDNPAVQVLLNPIGSSAASINIMPTTQPTKLFYNTVSMVMPILQQFFFLLVLNGISNELQLYSNLPLRITGLLRIAFGIVYGFFAALGMTGYIWAFRESWSQDANRFGLTWMVLWFLMHINFVVIDSVTILPLPALPFFLLIWIILNITSSISPVEVNPRFYRWGCALPTHQAYSMLMDIWAFGHVPKLAPALPILFTWWIVGCAASFLSHLYRCHKAWRLEARMPEPSYSPRSSIRENPATADNVENLHKTTNPVVVEMYSPCVPLFDCLLNSPPLGSRSEVVLQEDHHVTRGNARRRKRSYESLASEQLRGATPDPNAWSRFSIRGFE